MVLWRACRDATAAIALLYVIGASAAFAAPPALITQPIDESERVRLAGNIPAPALDPANDRGALDDATALDHMLLVMKRAPAIEAELDRLIDAMHDPKSADYHQWLTAQELGDRFGVAPKDRDIVRHWLESYGFTVNEVYRNGLVIDFSGTAEQVRQAFHAEPHQLVLRDGTRHIGNIVDPTIPAALSPAIEGIASLHDFFPKPRVMIRGTVAYDRKTGEAKPRFDVPDHGKVLHAVGPYDFDTIYNVMPLWKRGFTGQGIIIAAIEDTDLAHPSDWSSFRKTFGLDKFKQAKFSQYYPGCADPGANGDEVEAALDVEWASAAAPNATIELVACGDTKTTFGLDRALLNLLDRKPPPIISDSYGSCEPNSGHTEIALQNREAQMAAAMGTTLFIAEGDVGPDQCAIFEPESVSYSEFGVTGGDDTATGYAVDVGGTDFMAQYNADLKGSPVNRYWKAKNDQGTLASAKSYIPEIPWDDTCASELIYGDPVNGGFAKAYGKGGFCNSKASAPFYYAAGSGGPSTCYSGKPSVANVVSGTCKGNPKPSFQHGVPGIPADGLRDQPDISLFAATGVWGSFLVECFSDVAQGGAACTADNDAIMEGGGGTSFAAPAMAGIQALVDQKYGKQGDANYVYYKLAALQFQHHTDAACNASKLNGDAPAASCVFNDVTAGSIAVPCGKDGSHGYFDCYGASKGLLGIQSLSNDKDEPAFEAKVGYDLATGLGSVNAANLFDQWSSVGK